jgi:hypothetical protein
MENLQSPDRMPSSSLQFIVSDSRSTESDDIEEERRKKRQEKFDRVRSRPNRTGTSEEDDSKSITSQSKVPTSKPTTNDIDDSKEETPNPEAEQLVQDAK